MSNNWYASIWQAANDSVRPEFADFEWYAIDSQNLIAMFTTAGSGPILKNIFRDMETYLRVQKLFNNLPCIGRAEILEQGGIVDDWRSMAERGLYAFDFIDSYSEREHGRGYYLVARPEKALHIEDIPAWTREWLEGLRLNQVTFRLSYSDVPKAIVEGSEWL